MSVRAREDPEEALPPTKKVKTETAAGDGMEEGEGGPADAKSGKEDDNNYAMLSHMREDEVGITEYISKHKGVSAIIKQRYSDFIVNEISASGDVVHLTNTEVPVVVEEADPVGPVDSILPEDFLAQLRQIAAGSSATGSTASIPAGEDKNWRLRVHRAVKTAFPNVETKTEDKDGEKVITALLKTSGKDKRRQNIEWPSSKRDFPQCRFVLYKENKGTMDAINLLARFLKVKDKVFHYAGTKDKRGKTTQEVTAFKVHPQKLHDVNKFLRNITLGNYSYTDKQLRLGELKGNRFTIVLRNVVGEDRDIQTGMKSLRDVGFINYYGLQRFGTLSVPTHHVGRALLKESYEEAVNLIIAGNSDDNIPFRQTWKETKDPQKTLDQLDSRHYIEKQVLRYLVKNPTDFFGAVNAVPRNTRLIYPHSYQSEAWNTMASRRISQLGLKPVVGDLVLPPSAAPDVVMVDADSTQDTEADLEPKGSRPTRAKPIVLDATTVKKHTIYDVVLPLPGHDVIYPTNQVHTWYKEHLAKDGFDIEKMERKHKDYSLPGGYRAILVRPTDLEWTSFRYEDPTVSLALSDEDRMKGEEEPVSVKDGKLKALRLSFNLITSSYATMALREVLKSDTSPAQQASMNVT